MNEIFKRSGLSKEELCRTFNMGLGMVMATSQPDRVLELLNAEKEQAFIIGQAQAGEGRVWIDGETSL
jgi:phosphoribosylaminoimidazole (AIR) synthetase